MTFITIRLRAVLGDWAEGSTLIFLDNRFTEEWFERMHALGGQNPTMPRKDLTSLTTDDITRSCAQYDASFVVTEKPKEFELPKSYENSRFILYRYPRQQQSITIINGKFFGRICNFYKPDRVIAEHHALNARPAVCHKKFHPVI